MPWRSFSMVNYLRKTSTICAFYAIRHLNCHRFSILFISKVYILCTRKLIFNLYCRRGMLTEGLMLSQVCGDKNLTSVKAITASQKMSIR